LRLTGLTRTTTAMSNAISRKLDSVHQKGALRSVDVANIIGTHDGFCL